MNAPPPPMPKKKRKNREWRYNTFAPDIIQQACSSSSSLRKKKGACKQKEQGAGSWFGDIVQKCAMVPDFWRTLSHVKYVTMLTCVCQATRDALEPRDGTLPFWGVWCTCLPSGHQWDEINILMYVKRNDCKEIARYVVLTRGMTHFTCTFDMHCVQDGEGGPHAGHGRGCSSAEKDREEETTENVHLTCLEVHDPKIWWGEGVW